MRDGKAFVHKALAGFLIGLGFILPGVSGGVMAVTFGIYRPMLDAVVGFFREPKKCFLYLLPIALGGAVGALLGAQGLGYAMSRWEVPMLYLFIGFILGGIPALIHEADEDGFHLRYLWALVLGMGLAMPMLLVNGGAGDGTGELSFIQALLAGGAYAIGTVVPGLSTSFILIRLGWYQAALNAMGGLQLGTLLPMGLGFVLVAALTLKGVQWLFDHVRGYAYYGVLGFVLVSIGLVFPGLRQGEALLTDLLMAVIGLLVALRMSALGDGQVSS